MDARRKDDNQPTPCGFSKAAAQMNGPRVAQSATLPFLPEEDALDVRPEFELCKDAALSLIEEDDLVRRVLWIPPPAHNRQQVAPVVQRHMANASVAIL